MQKFFVICLLVFCELSFAAANSEPSVCFGTTDNGKLVNGWQLPNSGKNFSAYSIVASVIGRNYVHSGVYPIVLDSYADLEKKLPGKVFVYGETGWKSGGKFKPHKSHQNGLSVDFFVPVINREGQSVPLPTNALNKFGYDVEFDSNGKFKDLTIDFEAMAAHLWALKKAAEAHGIKIWRVIFDNELQSHLFKANGASGLQSALNFSTKKPWVRHDEHYHVDFIVHCEDYR